MKEGLEDMEGKTRLNMSNQSSRSKGEREQEKVHIEKNNGQEFS